MKVVAAAVVISAFLAATQRPALSQSAQGRDEEIVRVETGLVTLPVSVTDRDGRYVANLRQEDFRVYEDGAEQTIAFFSPVETPFTVALLIDTSPSTGFIWGEIVDAANVFMNQLRPDDRCLITFFDRKTHEIVRPTRIRDWRPLTVNYTPACCGTSLYDAVDFVLAKKLKKAPGKKAIVVFTDGVDTASRKTRADNLRLAEEMDVLIYPVQYDTLIRRDPAEGYRNVARGMRPEDYERASIYLRELAQRTGARLYRGDRSTDLAEAFAAIARELGRQYSVGYYPRRPVKRGQRRRVKVGVNVPGLIVHTRESYTSWK